MDKWHQIWSIRAVGGGRVVIATCVHGKSHVLHRCMNMFIKEKEHVLGIDTNPRAWLLYPVDIGRFYKPHRNAVPKEYTKKTNEDTEKESLQIATPANDTN